MSRQTLVGCVFQGDTFCALWLEDDGDYVLGWTVGDPLAAQSKLRYRDRAQAAEAYGAKLRELQQMVA